MNVSHAEARCGSCAHFRNDAATLEAAMPGLSSLTSLGASTRADDGWCLRRELYLGARAGCAEFTARTARAAPRGGA